MYVPTIFTPITVKTVFQMPRSGKRCLWFQWNQRLPYYFDLKILIPNFKRCCHKGRFTCMSQRTGSHENSLNLLGEIYLNESHWPITELGYLSVRFISSNYHQHSKFFFVCANLVHQVCWEKSSWWWRLWRKTVDLRSVTQCTPSSLSGSLFIQGFDLRQQTASLGRFRQMKTKYASVCPYTEQACYGSFPRNSGSFSTFHVQTPTWHDILWPAYGWKLTLNPIFVSCLPYVTCPDMVHVSLLPCGM